MSDTDSPALDTLPAQRNPIYFRVIKVVFIAWVALSCIIYIGDGIWEAFYGQRFYKHVEKGWPLNYLKHYESSYDSASVTEYVAAYLILDVIIFIIGCSGCLYCLFHLKAWDEPKFSLRKLFPLTALSCILVSIVPNEGVLHEIIGVLFKGRSFVNWSLYSANLFLRLVYLTVLACAIWTSFGLVQFIPWLARKVARRIERPTES